MVVEVAEASGVRVVAVVDTVVDDWAGAGVGVGVGAVAGCWLCDDRLWAAPCVNFPLSNEAVGVVAAIVFAVAVTLTLAPSLSLPPLLGAGPPPATHGGDPPPFSCSSSVESGSWS